MTKAMMTMPVIKYPFKASPKASFPRVSFKARALAGWRTLLAAGLIGAALGAAAPAQAGSGPALKSGPYGSYLAGLHASRNNDFQAAATFMDAALAANPESDLLAYQAFESHWRAGNMARAAELARALDKARNGKVPAFLSLILGLEAMRGGDYDAADTHLQRAARSAATQTVLPFAQAWRLAALDRHEEAIKLLEGAQGASQPIVDIMAGKIQEYFGDLDAAEAAYLGSAKDPLTLPAPMVRAIVRLKAKRGDLEGARTLLSGFMAQYPGIVELEDDMNRLMRDKSLPPLTATPLEGVAEGIFHMAQGFAGQNWEIALDFMRLAVSLDPNMTKGQIYIGSLLDERGRYGEANRIYGEVPSDSPLSWQARRLAARNLYEMDKKEEALDRLEEMAVERPGHVEALNEIGLIYRRESKYEEMAATYDRLIDRLNGDRREYWRYYYLRGNALERLKRWEGAERDFLHALELYPDQPDVLNYLGYSWVDMNMNLDRALGMLNKAVELRRSGYIIDSLGWAYYRLGRYEDAVAQLERAVYQEPLEPVINDHLGDAYWKVGRHREARYQWERVLSLEATDEVDQDEVARKLEAGLPDDG